MTENGHKPALPFPRAGQIPILGQPCTVRAWFPTVMVTCNCEAQSALLIVSTNAAECPACHRRFMINGVTFDAQRNVLNISLALAMGGQETEGVTG